MRLLPMGARASAGGDYESGMAITAGNWTTASNGDVTLNIAAAFGTADEAVGTVGPWWSFVTPTENIAWATLPSTTIGSGDTFTINSGSLQLNGATT